MRGQRHALAAPYPREGPGTHCTVGWVDLRAGKYKQLLLANDRVSFPMHKTYASTSAIDNIFIARNKIYTIYPFINGLSDHEAQILVRENIVLPKQRNNITTKGTSMIKIYWNFNYY